VETGTLFGPEKTAVLSPCGLYRYRLGREVQADGGTVNFVMLNPSTADASIDDPTIRRCVGFARSWGFGGLVVTNLYGLRSTDPAGLLSSPDPVGPDNDRHVREVAGAAGLVVCAWGAFGAPSGRARVARVLGLIREAGRVPHYLKLTAAGHPGHPLFLRSDLTPIRWEG
jgi:hypothetical protein